MGRFGIVMKKVSLLLVFISSLYGQAPDTLFTRTFGDVGNDIAFEVHSTNDGGSVLAGRINSSNDGINRGYVVKTDLNGDEEWSQIYDDGGITELYSIKQTLDNGYICVGLSYSLDESGHLFLLKLNSFGEIEWNQIHGENVDYLEYGRDIIQTNDGGYAISGIKYFDQNLDESKIWVLKTDSLGNALWEYTFGNGNFNFGSSIISLDNGELVVAGSKTVMDSNGGWGECGIVLKIGQEGNEIWNQIYCSDSLDIYSIRFQDHKITSDDGYIMTGYVVDEFYTKQILLLKTDSNGEEIWRHSYGNSGNDQGYSLEKTQDNGYIITGYISNPSPDLYIFKLDSLGTQEWEIILGGDSTDSLNDKGYSIDKTSNNEYVIGGYTSNYGNGGIDFWLVKIGSEILSIDQTPIPYNFVLHQNYPNPFNPVTTLRYDLPEDAMVNITIYDMVGRQVNTLDRSQQTAGFKSIRWNATNDKGFPVSAGLYLYTIEAGQYRQTKKMVLLK
jgi:hypothetical protein